MFGDERINSELILRLEQFYNKSYAKNCYWSVKK